MKRKLLPALSYVVMKFDYDFQAGEDYIFGHYKTLEKAQAAIEQDGSDTASYEVWRVTPKGGLSSQFYQEPQSKPLKTSTNTTSAGGFVAGMYVPTTPPLEWKA